MIEIKSNSTEETKEIGLKFANILKKGDTLVLSGELGAGKTVFVSGFLSKFGKENEAASPTFTIISEHDLTEDLKLFHFDVYRFDFEEEFLAIGGDEFYDKGICIIEWGEKIKNLLPKQYIEIKIERDHENKEKRNIKITPNGEKYEKIIREVFEE